MKVLILAGGYGSRLGSITELVPKPMVKIGNKPIIWHIMKYYSTFGHNDFVISSGYKAEAIKTFFYNYNATANDFTINLGTKNISIHSNHDESQWNVTIIDTGLKTLKGARIKRCDKYIDEVNCLTYGDGLSNVNIDKLLKFHNSHGKILTLSGVSIDSKFGEIVENDGLIRSFSEKPKLANKFINGGFMVFNKELLEYLTYSEDCDFEVGAIETLIKKNQVMVYKHTGEWMCMDHERDLYNLIDLWNHNKAFWKTWK
ncbi:MAG TPA: sugar phosphate nucleotidyltransferase [Victivallales bacterium]|nr:sugar phosphate nucleotidyltransferase [Victivallales bacterium]